MSKIDMDKAIPLLRVEYKKHKAPIVSFIAKNGSSPFRILIATILSARTKDETTGQAIERLFSVADTPEEMLKLSEQDLQKLIFPVGFYRNKARALLKVCKVILRDYQGEVPSNLEELLKIPGVGRKSANLILIEAFGKDAICVDTHVHRISNRFGYVQTETPEETEMVLRRSLPKKYWQEYNKLLVSFGQTVCVPISPFCSTCVLNKLCPKIGVKQSR